MYSEIKDNHTVADCVRMLGYELRCHDENPLHATRKRCMRIAQDMHDKFTKLIFSIYERDVDVCLAPLQRLRAEIDSRMKKCALNDDTNWLHVYSDQLAELDGYIRDIQIKGKELMSDVGCTPAVFEHPLETLAPTLPVTS